MAGRSAIDRVAVAKYPPPKPHTIALEIIDFIACLREGRRPINTEVEGISVLKVILAAYASADQKRIVALSARDLGHECPGKQQRLTRAAARDVSRT